MPHVLIIAAAALGAYGGTVGAAVWFYAMVEIGMAAYAYIQYQNLKKRRPEDRRRGHGFLVNTQSTDAVIPVVYGRHRVGGNRVYVNSTGSDNDTVHMIVTLSEGPIEGVESIYLGDKEISTFGSLAYYEFYSGTGTQVHGAADGKWADNLRFTAYLYIKLTYDQDKFTRGIPRVTAVIKGRQIHDPRTGSDAYSANPALVWRDWMTNSRYGLGLDVSMIDDASVIDAANWCEAQTNPYAFNGVMVDRQAFIENIADIMRNFRAETVWGGGKQKLLIRKDETPIMDLTEDDIVADSFRFTVPGIAETPNRVVVTYPEESGAGLISGEITSWTASGATLSNVLGRLRVANSTTSVGEAYQAFTTVIGDKYTLSLECFAGSSNASWYLSNSAPGSYTGGLGTESSVTGVRKASFTASATTTYLRLVNVSTVSGEYSEYDNFSIQKVTDTQDLGWVEREIVIEDSSAVLTFDGEERDFELDLVGTTNAVQGHLLGVYGLERARLNKTFSFAAHPRTIALEPGDVIQVAHSTPGWSAPQLVTNGAFDADTDWTKGTGWTISVGAAHCDGTQGGASALSQDVSAVSGASYEIGYTISGLTAGTVQPYVGGQSGVARAANGTYVERITSVGTDSLIKLQADALFVGDIDNVTLYSTVGVVRVVSLSMGDDGMTAMTVQEESPLLYDEALNLSPDTFYSTTLPDIAAPVGDILSAGFTEEEYYNKDVSYTRLKITITPPSSPMWAYSEVWVDIDGFGYNQYGTTTGDFKVEPLKEGAVYSFKFVSVSVQGVRSNIADATARVHTVVGSQTPPDDPTTFTSIPQSDTIVLRWDAVNNVDLLGYEVRRGTAWDGGLFIGFTRAVNMRINGVPPGSHTYMLKTVDTKGKYSNSYLLTTAVVYGPASYTEKMSESNDFATYPTYTTSAKSLGDRVLPTTPNGYCYECVVAGTPSAEPTWPTANGAQVVDGGVTWTCYEDHVFTNTERYNDPSHGWVLRVNRGGGGNLTGSYMSPVYDRGSTITRRSWLQYDTTYVGTGTAWTDQFLPTDLWTDVFLGGDTWIDLYGPYAAGSLTAKFWYSSNGISWSQVATFEALTTETQARYVKYELALTDIDAAGFLYVFAQSASPPHTFTLKEAYWV